MERLGRTLEIFDISKIETTKHAEAHSHPEQTVQ